MILRGFIWYSNAYELVISNKKNWVSQKEIETTQHGSEIILYFDTGGR